MKFGILAALQLPKPWKADSEFKRMAGRSGADGSRGSQRDRLPVAGRAPFPGRVLPFLGRRDIFGRGQPAHQTDAPGVRNHPDTAEL